MLEHESINACGIKPVSHAAVGLAKLLGVLLLAGLSFGCDLKGGANVTDSTVVEPLANSEEWRVLGNGNEQLYYSNSSKINTSNVSDLGLAWFTDLPIRDGLQGNALVADGLIYQSAPLGVAFAHDLHTGELRWRYDAHADLGESPLALWAARVNRGLALWGDKIIFSVGDCSLHAVNRFSGKLAWNTRVCESSDDYSVTSAPRVGNGMVFTGNGCFDIGSNRGYVDALDAETGERQWRFYTVPGEPPKGGFTDPLMAKAAATWGDGNWWERSVGCGSAWDGLTYDEQTNLLFVGTGGAMPWSPADRGVNAGDELFTNAIVALDADNGKYVWHYTVTPGDGWNLEAAIQMMVTDLVVDGVERRVVMAAPKNGFFYLLDALSGEFLSANNYVPVNWALGIDQNSGRPIPNPAAQYWNLASGSAEVTPSVMGARSWHPMSYSPDTELAYIPAAVHSARYSTQAIDGAMGGTLVDYYIAQKGEAEVEPYGQLIAWDPVRQKKAWVGRRKSLPFNAGVSSTAGGLVFQGTSDGYFEAYDAKGGELLWSMYLGSIANAAPTIVEVEGEQIVLLPVGNGASGGISVYPKLGSLSETKGPSRLLAFKLGGKLTLPKTEPIRLVKPGLPQFSTELAEEGALLAEANLCVACHGMEAVSMNGSVPDLRNSPIVYNLDALKTVVRDGALKERGMPQFSEISDSELVALQAFVTNSAWRHYEAQKAKGSDGGH